MIVLREVSFLECKEVGGRYNESTKECLIERERVDYPLNTKEAELMIKRYESKGEKAKLEWMSPTRFLASMPHLIRRLRGEDNNEEVEAGLQRRCQEAGRGRIDRVLVPLLR